jgi:hypothetical protein
MHNCVCIGARLINQQNRRKLKSTIGRGSRHSRRSRKPVVAVCCFPMGMPVIAPGHTNRNNAKKQQHQQKAIIRTGKCAVHSFRIYLAANLTPAQNFKNAGMYEMDKQKYEAA